MDHPIAVETLDQVQELFVAGWLDEIGVGAKMIGVVDRFNARVAGENNNHEMAELGLSAQPREQFETIETRHVDVDDEHAWHRITATVCELATTQEIRHGVNAVLDYLERPLHTGPGERLSK